MPNINDNGANLKLTNRQKQAQETKKRLFESALNLFTEKGFEKVLIKEITTKAGTSKGSFYTYFKTKDAVFFDFYDRLDREYLTEYKKFPESLSSKEKILKILSFGFDYTANFSSKIISIVISHQLNESTYPPSIIDEKRVLGKIISQIIRQGQSSGEFNNRMTAQQYTDILLTYYRGINTNWAFLNGNFNLVEVGKSKIKNFVEVILLNSGNE